MAWTTKFNGQDFGLISDDSHDDFLALARTALSEGRGVTLQVLGDPYELVGLWTPGVPITFERFDGAGFDAEVALF